MKTEGLTFWDAAQSLRDGRCSEIYSETTESRWANYGILATMSFGRLEDDLATSDWQLIDPVPEKRTVKGWVNIRTNVSFPEGVHYYLSRIYGSEIDALSARNGNRDYCGDPLYIEHTYEVPK